jgi:hypothetical protein
MVTATKKTTRQSHEKPRIDVSRNRERWTMQKKVFSRAKTSVMVRALAGISYAYDQPGWQKSVLRRVDVFSVSRAELRFQDKGV